MLLGIRTLLYYGLMVWATEYMEFGLYSVLMRFSGFSTWDSGSFYNKAANEGAPSSALHPATTALTVISWLWGGACRDVLDVPRPLHPPVSLPTLQEWNLGLRAAGVFDPNALPKGSSLFLA